MTVTADGVAGSRPGARASGQGRARSGIVEHLSRADRVARGKDARAVAPLESHAEFKSGQSRDPVGLLLEQAMTRVPELVPVRHGRMLVSPFTFYRGAALPMAADLATTPTSGLRVQLCGDAHLSNFGAFASPERRLVFDVNDFDETLPGPFEWDVKRLAASLAVAGRDNGFSRKDRRQIELAATEGYRTAMRAFAGQHFLDVWYAHLDVEDAIAEFRSQFKAKRVKATEKRHLPRLDPGGRPGRGGPRLLRAPAEGLEILRPDRADDSLRHDGLRPPVRVDPGPGTRLLRRPHCPGRLPRRLSQIRPGDRRLRRDLRRPERTRLRRAPDRSEGGQGKSHHRDIGS
jgi:hypothetical protein